jgi:hypothetical protein
MQNLVDALLIGGAAAVGIKHRRGRRRRAFIRRLGRET